MQIKFVKTHPDAVIPTRGSAGAAGFDLTAVSLKRAADLYIYDIGIAMEIPAGYFAAIFPRSSIFFTGLELTNCVGVIDSDFRAPISAKSPATNTPAVWPCTPCSPEKRGSCTPTSPATASPSSSSSRAWCLSRGASL